MPERQTGGTWTCVTGALREAAAAEQFASLHVALEELRPEPGGEVIVLLFFFWKRQLAFPKAIVDVMQPAVSRVQ